jgi:DNA-binding beta-propeller fold protein YncE
VVDVVDTGANKILSTHKITDVSGIVTGLALSGDGDRAYLVTDDGVTVLCARTQDIIGAVGLSNQPSCVVESPNGKYLYVADYSGAVTVAPVASVVAPGIEPAAHWDDTAAEDDAAAEWAMPELPQLEPALA